MASPIDLSALILSVARSCDEAIRELKKSNAEVELDQVEMTVTVEADIDDEVLRTPPRGSVGIPGLKLDLKSRILTGRPAAVPGSAAVGRTPSTRTPKPAADSDDGQVTGKIELRLLLSRKE
ncbi:MAG: hypothetical protein SGJ05_07310 [bacterium]|nr:hypothetical protein [bacterium]